MSIPASEHGTPVDGTLIDRVRKLLDKAAATSNAHEADAFSRKAAELIARHRIDPERLADESRRGELAIRQVPLGRGAYVRARLALLVSIADAHDARVVFGSTPTGTVAHVAGFTDDLDVIETLYHSLHAQASSQMAAVRRPTAASTQRYRRSFLFGFADRVGELLATARDRVAAERDRSGEPSTELALRQRIARVDDYADQEFGRTRRARAAAAAQIGGWTAGVDAADRADVGRSRLAGRPAIGPGS